MVSIEKIAVAKQKGSESARNIFQRILGGCRELREVFKLFSFSDGRKEGCEVVIKSHNFFATERNGE